jgi:hypothetical protein
VGIKERETERREKGTNMYTLRDSGKDARQAEGALTQALD